MTVLGVALFVASVGWWWLVYGNVVNNGYISHAQAAVCLAANTDLCRLAQALCTNSHFFDIRWYAPEGFWVAGALLAVAIFQNGLQAKIP